jgi:hypothetical protein
MRLLSKHSGKQAGVCATRTSTKNHIYPAFLFLFLFFFFWDSLRNALILSSSML